MSTQEINLITFFDRLPTEIIFMIFKHLSNNDIIYTFFHFNQRLNYLLLQNKHYLNSLELPITNFDFWKNLLLIIGSQVECLNIKTIDLSFPLTYFTNLKSLIISSSYIFPTDQLKLIFGSDQFQNLNSFKVKPSKICSFRSSPAELIGQEHILKKVFNPKNSLQIFEYSLQISLYRLHVKNFSTNFSLRSLTLILYDFNDIFYAIRLTPNLEYLNIQSPLWRRHKTLIKKIDINLKEFHFTEKANLGRSDFDMLFSCIKQFSSSLICLSLNLIDLYMREIPFNSLKLQQFLESMIQLQQFHLYAKLSKKEINNESILLDNFWFDHNWFFGMHGCYLYTLPFHFDYVYRFDEGFDGVKCTNSDLLETNPRLWYNVKSIDLRRTWEYDLNLIKQLKIKMPKLTFIRFDDESIFKPDEAKDIFIKKNENETSNITLNNVTTVECRIESGENKKEWLTHVLPNLTHLILSQNYFPQIDDELKDLLNKKIQRLDITEGDTLRPSSEGIFIYFSNVEHIFYDLSKQRFGAGSYIKTFLVILSKKNLKTLLIYSDKKFLSDIDSLIRNGNQDNGNKIMETYHMKQFDDEYCLFTKKLV